MPSHIDLFDNALMMESYLAMRNREDKMITGASPGLDENGLYPNFTLNVALMSDPQRSADFLEDGEVGILRETVETEGDEFKLYSPVEGSDRYTTVYLLPDEEEGKSNFLLINYPPDQQNNLRDRLGFTPGFNITDHVRSTIDSITRDALHTNIQDRFACSKIQQTQLTNQDLSVITTVEETQSVSVELLTTITTATSVEAGTTTTSTNVTTGTPSDTTFGFMSAQSETGY